VRPVSSSPVVRLVHPIHVGGGGISACALAIADAWQELGLRVEYWAAATAPTVRRSYHRLPVPPLRARLHYKFQRPEPVLSRRVEDAVLAAVRPGDVVVCWPGTTLEFVAESISRGARIVVERVNSHRERARAILDRLYAVHGLDRRRPLLSTHAHGRHDALRETRKLEMADVLVSPSPFVTDSLHAAGLDPTRIVHGSLGHDAHTFRPRPRAAHQGAVRFVHLGSDVLRKGLGELLAAWRLAGAPGELHAIGDVPRELAVRWASDLAHPRVRTTPWIDDVAAEFAASDVYVLASHEEGSPISTYLAMAAGLPCLVSPAGSGGVVRDGVDGFVVDPFDVARWADRLRRLARDAELRRVLGANARERAQQFTFERVARRRWQAIADVLTRSSRQAA
jgi:glycosyltransferase involved in cell wall biosynthesis